ncbi:MAG: hypothetical protein PVJ83_09100 [Gammaproteobacteria bacterium]
MNSLKILVGAVALAAAVSAIPACAVDERNTVPGLTAAGAPLGLHGVDPVAFIQLGNRIEGSAKHTATHDGVAYYFAAAENRQAFERAPAKVVSGFIPRRTLLYPRGGSGPDGAHRPGPLPMNP